MNFYAQYHFCNHSSAADTLKYAALGAWEVEKGGFYDRDGGFCVQTDGHNVCDYNGIIRSYIL